MNPAFESYVGIDYSGAETPVAGLAGLRVYQAGQRTAAQEVRPPCAGKHWTRKAIADWLANTLVERSRTIVGIDHGFSFPLRYFEWYELAHDWPAFLDDFQTALAGRR